MGVISSLHVTITMTATAITTTSTSAAALTASDYYRKKFQVIIYNKFGAETTKWPELIHTQVLNHYVVRKVNLEKGSLPQLSQCTFPPKCIMGTDEFNSGVNLRWTGIPIRGN